ncbi:class I SAM-dependent methyltransferase [Parashewanella curva]|uniref:Class I SAM-dependent methyltransferase n=1 Tax=Parashewanella curva TaxID=2338552 RepID=A0A3L8Q0K0_9GAMM|nr:class I SAM-dependent methyltransferase [Parashewanella curva]RLV61197.1 class I SAM-dependent methyltransferase [Parashewanella curva]
MITSKPKSWLELPSGEQALRSLCPYINEQMSQVFGYHLLKLGALSSELDTKKSSIAHHFSIVEKGNASLLADYTHLPLQKRSIDCVLAALLLEFETNPYRVLREVSRVLISGGHLILVGCNPLSPLLVGKASPKHRQLYPWNGRFFTAHRVRDWLEVLGYQVIDQKKEVYHPLIGKFSDNSLWQQWMRNWLPFSGSFYVIIAKKVECPLTPSKAWKKQRATNWSTAPSAGRVNRG